MQGEEKWKFSPRHISRLQGIWGEVSRLDGTISAQQLNKLVRSLQRPIGVGPTATKREAQKFVDSRNVVTVRPGRYTFEHVVFALVAGLAEQPLPDTNLRYKLESSLANYFLAVRSANVPRATLTWRLFLPAEG